MSTENSGCSKFLGPLGKFFAVKDSMNRIPNTRSVKSQGIEVELTEDQPDEVAELFARPSYRASLWLDILTTTAGL